MLRGLDRHKGLKEAQDPEAPYRVLLSLLLEQHKLILYLKSKIEKLQK